MGTRTGSEVREVARRLHARLLLRRRQQAGWDAEEARDLREVERERIWTDFGCVTVLEYLELHCGYSPRVALDRLRVATALGALPLIEAELEHGTYTYSHVRELTRIAIPETEEAWVAHTKSMTVGQIERAKRGLKPGDLPEAPMRRTEEVRSVRLTVGAAAAARFEALCRQIEVERGERFVDDTDRLQSICDFVEGTLVQGATGEPASVARPPAQVWITPEGDASANGEPLPADERDLMLCDASDMGRVDDPSARTYTAISRRKRTRLLARDFQRCTVPGCRSHRFLDLHHIVAREEGGTDADDNLTTLCAGHHRLLHRGRLALSGSAPGALVVRRIQDASP